MSGGFGVLKPSLPFSIRCRLDRRHSGCDEEGLSPGCGMGGHHELPRGCDVEMYGSDLPSDAPMSLCLGEGGAGVSGAGVRTLQLTFSPACSGHQAMMAAAKATFRQILSEAKDHRSKGVYLIGYGVGALLAAKLLSDVKLIREYASSHLLQAAYLIAGIYDLKHDPHLQSFFNSNQYSPSDKPNSPCGSPVRGGGEPRKLSLIDNIITDHQLFKDRNSVSFICEMSDQSHRNYSLYDNDSKKCRQIHGIHLAHEDSLKNSPVFQNLAVGHDEDRPGKTHQEEDQADMKRHVESAAMEEIELFKMLSHEIAEFSPLYDEYKHLRKMHLRIYVFAAERDGPAVTKQSRDMFDRLSSGCDQEDMHFQVREKIDRKSMRELLCQEDNFLRRLIRYDIVKHL